MGTDITVEEDTSDSLPRGKRERLPKRRPNGPQEIIIKSAKGYVKAYLDVGRYPDGRPGEVWLNVAKVGSDLNNCYNAWAMTASKALQYGMPLKELAGTVRNIKDHYGGKMFLTDEEISKNKGVDCSSLWDAVGRVLEIEAGE